MSNPSLPPYPGSQPPRRFSYASVVQGNSSLPASALPHQQPSRSTSFTGHQYQPAHMSNSTSHSRHASRAGQDDAMHPSGLSSSWGRSAHHAPYSLLTAGLEESKQPSFFIPSYMRGTRHARRLEEQHAKRLAAQRDARSAHSSNAASLSTSASSVNLHKMVPSHRGMTHEIIERAAPGSSPEEAPAPLPSRWGPMNDVQGMDLLNGGTDARYSGLSKQEGEAAVLRGDCTIPRECGFFYFEVTVGSKTKEGSVQISIGLAAPKVTTRRVPGWEPESYGYSADDGSLLLGNSGNPKKYGPSYSNTDVIGCGINFNKGHAFFTKNGNHLGTAITSIRSDKLYPAVGLRRAGDSARVNFGQTRFVFDIDSLVEDERDEIRQEINRTSVATLAPPLTEPQLIHKLIAQYLAHDGYIETARAFAEEVRQENTALASGTGVEPNLLDLEPQEDHDAIKRQKIRSAILDGDVDRAIKFTSVYYPDVLSDNEHIYFRIRCRKFIEMIRRCAELMDLEQQPPSHHHPQPTQPKNSAADDYNGVFDDQMELDPHSHNPGTLHTNGSGSKSWSTEASAPRMSGTDPMQTSTDDLRASSAPTELPQTYDEMLAQTLEYGAELKAEFDADPRREVKKVMEETLALIGYEDPRLSPLRHLLEESERAPVAEELNRVILVALGKSSTSALEKVFAQTDVLMDLAGKDGGPGAFIDLRADPGPGKQGRNAWQEF